MRKVVGIGLVLTILVITFLSACAPPPPPVVNSSKTVEINILGGDKGSTMYVLSYGLTQILSKAKSWVQANVVETSGTSSTVMGIDENPKTAIGCMGDKNWYDAQTGAKPYPKAIPINALMKTTYSVMGFVTLDPKIRTVKDMAGKRVTGFATDAYLKIYRGLLESYNLTFDDKNFNSMSWEKAFDALKAGKVDVALCAFAGSSAKVISPNPALEEMMSIKGSDLYFIPVEAKALEYSRNKYGYPWFPRTISMGVHPALKQDIQGYSDTISWYCHNSFPEDVAYEIVKVAVENYSEFSTYWPTAKGYTPEGFPDVGIESKYIHPGAMRLYKDKNIALPSY